MPKNLVHLLHSLLTPSFTLTQPNPLRLPDEFTTLCVHHDRGRGYTAYETRTNRGEESILPETYESGLTRQEAYEYLVQSGARKETLWAFGRNLSLDIPLPPPVLLELHTHDGVYTFSLMTPKDADDFLSTIAPTIRAYQHDALTCLIGRENGREVAWQSALEARPWGGSCIGKVQRLLPGG